MIECTNKRIYRKNRRKIVRRFFVFLIIFCLISFFYFKIVTEKQIYKICTDYAKIYAVESVNDVILTSLKQKNEYSDFVSYEKNKDGDIVMLNANSIKINELTQEIVSEVAKKLNVKLKRGIPIPCFAFSGIKFLSGYGRIIMFKTLSVSDVSCVFSSKFTSVGINQTLHSIYANIVCVVKTDFPLNNKTETVSTEILISETVLVGKIPEIYLNGKLFS